MEQTFALLSAFFFGLEKRPNLVNERKIFLNVLCTIYESKIIRLNFWMHLVTCHWKYLPKKHCNGVIITEGSLCILVCLVKKDTHFLQSFFLIQFISPGFSVESVVEILLPSYGLRKLTWREKSSPGPPLIILSHTSLLSKSQAGEKTHCQFTSRGNRPLIILSPGKGGLVS